MLKLTSLNLSAKSKHTVFHRQGGFIQKGYYYLPDKKSEKTLAICSVVT